MKRKRPKGVVVFSSLILLSSFMHLNTLHRQSGWYASIYGYWPEWLIGLRYFFSWAQRIIGITAAVGVLCLKNFYRKLAITLGCFVILTVYWKHPYQAFLRSNTILDKRIGPILEQAGLQEFLLSIGLEPVNFASYTAAAVIIHCLLDIAFWVVFIYYFTRPEVRQVFLNTNKGGL